MATAKRKTPTPKLMPEPMRTLVLEGIKMAGKIHPAEDALAYVEEQMTVPEYKDAKAFLDWLYSHGLTIGHGTIQLRYHEYTN